jgi:uncharacterized RDD family membrane protein YckC
VATTRPTDGATPAWFVEPTFGQRLTAAAVDGMVLLLLTIAVTRFPMGATTQRATTWVLSGLYLIGAVSLTGRTVGKRALGLRVAAVDTGALPGLGAATVRWLVVTLPAVVPWFVPALRGIAPVVTLLIYLPVLQPPLHRGLHDRAAGTVVVAKAG